MKIAGLQISPGHNFFGRHGKPRGAHETVAVDRVECGAGHGLRGDRFWDYKPDYAGQVTFFAEEVHRALLVELKPVPCPAAAYRRNVITRGVDLNELIGREFEVQGVRFSGSAECKPCYWMDQAIGAGAEKFLRGRGGLRARILSDGELTIDCATAAGLVLAGGRSTRMGRDKAALDWNGVTLAEHQAATLAASGAWPLYWSCRPGQRETPAGFLRLEDAADGGALAALVGALQGNATPVLAVLAIDLPLVTPEFLERVTGLARETGKSVVPFNAGRFEPFAAAWHKSALPVLEANLQAGRPLQEACARLRDAGLLHALDVPREEARALLNVNTPSDLAAALE